MAKRRSRKPARTTDSTSDAHDYPRPQLVRDAWVNLNGRWDFAIDADARWTSPQHVTFNETIVVPFAPETPMSGIGRTDFFRQCWYRRTLNTPKMPAGGQQRVLLHFGAVDHRARVWVNGQLAVEHEGGYTPFFADITDLLAPEKRQQTIEVCAIDDPHDLAKPRGKQDWQLDAHSIWYPRTTGIWQTVWLEIVPRTHIASLRWTPVLERSEMLLRARISGPPRDGLRLAVRLKAHGRVIVDDVYHVRQHEVIRAMTLGDPGVEDFCSDLLWSPDHPTLLDAEVRLLDADGGVIDSVKSYTAMRCVSVDHDRFLLNRRPVVLRLVLDQGYWEKSGLTAPDDDALRRDVELVKQMGFNGVRKHQKIEDPRFLYWADRLGLLVWEEMPSCYRFGHTTIRRLMRDWLAVIERDYSHPCIVTWVPFNESWGVPDLPQVEEQREFVRAMYHMTRAIDRTRPIVGNDGWEVVASDIIGIHDYDSNPEQLARRYGGSVAQIEHMFKTERPGHRVLLLDGCSHAGRPIMLTEFGGIAFTAKRGAWGYSRASSATAFAKQYRRLLETVRSIPSLAGFCYTQFTDTYQEANGLLHMDRSPKFPIEKIARATRG